jgi:hypothetical protein
MADTGGVGVSGNGGRHQPREFAEELRAISDAENVPQVTGDPRALIKPPARMEEAPGLRPPRARNVHRVIQRRVAPQAVQEEVEIADEVIVIEEPPEIEAPMTEKTQQVENGQVASAVARAAELAVRGLPTEEENDLLHVLCFLEERSLPELVEAVIREYLESRAGDEDVQSVLKARSKYRKV